MPRFAIVTNPLAPLSGCTFVEAEPGSSINDFIEHAEIDMTGKMCVVDSVVIPEDQFSLPVADDAIAIICPQMGWNFVVYAIIAIVAAIAVVAFMPVPKMPTNAAEADPVYTLRGQKNQARLSEPIERHYGKVRFWPSYMSRPYNVFHSNDQYLYALFCIGLGCYEIDAIQIEDTPIGDFDDVDYEVYQPGDEVTMFPTNVQTSTEVGGIELLGPNEEDFPGWSGPFVACSSGSRARKLQLDFTCRQGLFGLSKKGAKQPVSVTFRAEYRAIDDSGSATGSWTLLEEVTKTNDDDRPQRFTISQDVTLGRYEVRVKRISDKSDNIRIRDAVHWEGLRAICKENIDFGNVTLLAVKAKATNNLNDSSSSAFNVIVTGKVKVYDSLTDTWTLTTTRNPAWIALDILRSNYGRKLNLQFIDLDSFVNLAEELNEEGIKFDGTFDQRMTVWDALTAVLSVARAVPVMQSGVVSVVRDKPATVPTLGFNGNNIGRGTFQVSTKLVKRADNDGLEVEYINGDTWKRETVRCLLDGDRGNNPRRVNLLGCTDRDRAYRWGMYHRAVEVYQRDNITFETGIEGGTARFGDLVAVKHELLTTDDTYRFEETGRLAFNAFGTMVVSGDTVTKILLPFDPVFNVGETYRIAMRDRWGLVRGPYTCHKHSTEANTVYLDVLLELEDIEVAEQAEQPSFWFGVSGSEFVLFKVMRVEATDGNKVRLTAVPYDERIYGFDSLTAPENTNSMNTPQPGTLTAVTNLKIKRFPRSLKDYNVSWKPVFGANSYTVSKSTDGTNYVYVNTVTNASILMTLENGEVWIKVRAVNKGAGPAAVLNVILSDPTEAPEQPDPPVLAEVVNDSFELTWPDVVEATSYIVKAYSGYGTTFYLSKKEVTANRASFSKEWLKKWVEKKELPFFGRQFTFTVTAKNAHGSSAASTSVMFEKPSLIGQIPTGLTNTNLGGGTYRLSWSSSGFADGMYFKLYIDMTNGFLPPAEGTLKLNATRNYYDYTPAGFPRYWRVIVDDDWGDDATVFMSNQKTLNA